MFVVNCQRRLPQETGFGNKKELFINVIENKALKMKVLTSGKTNVYLIKLPLLGQNTRRKNRRK